MVPAQFAEPDRVIHKATVTKRIAEIFLTKAKKFFLDLTDQLQFAVCVKLHIPEHFIKP